MGPVGAGDPGAGDLVVGRGGHLHHFATVGGSAGVAVAAALIAAQRVEDLAVAAQSQAVRAAAIA